MDTTSGNPTFFVSRHHEHPPATLEELLKASAKRNAAAKTANTGQGERRLADDDDTDSDYHAEESDEDLDDSEPEVDEWRLHAIEPREDLYLQEMRRQRGRMGEKEAQWVCKYIKAQRAWKDRTGHSIDEFRIPKRITRRKKKTRSLQKGRPDETLKALAQDEEDEENVSLLTGVTRLETLLLLAAIVFVCLSLSVQLYVSITNKQDALAE
ncbi:hypothetical protein PR003_g10921 [Phytophthora rubi]|uniref:Uncharacterized protein n=1 Tax=Phytophthora rubi TaxID=129364 RepID=A0A6A4F4E8_9STRA|nr:hypothetical protein PR003_g10921 [Phytophthora rubi]